MEQLQAEALGEAPVEKKVTGTSGRRKRAGEYIGEPSLRPRR